MGYGNPLHGLDSNGDPVREPTEVVTPDGPHDPAATPPFQPRTAERLIALTEQYVREVTALTAPTRRPGSRDGTPRQDAGTRAFQTATGHDCPACPLPVRELYAAAHNANQAWHAAWEANRQGLAGDYTQAHRKQQELADALTKIAPLLDAHFDALHQWSDQ